MRIPYQAKSVNRENRVGAAKAAGVKPAFWGDLAKRVAIGALQGAVG